MSKIEVNAVEPQCGTTLTIGASDTSIAGIGTVNWDTTKKTAAFTAVSGRGYFVDTSSSAITATLPASPSAGDIVSIADYTNTFQTNNCTVAGNGSNIGGISTDAILSSEGQSVTFVYVDATEGWKNVQDSTSNVTGNPFIVATGGTITEDGNCKIHTFTGPGTFTVSAAAICAANNQVSYMVVAGGGGSGGRHGGGGGAGGFREDKSPVTPYTASPLEGAGSITVTATDFPITVGAGGTAGVYQPSPFVSGGQGANSVFSTITSAGGGGGVTASQTSATISSDGGSGGGGALCGVNNTPRSPNEAAGLGNTPPVSPSQGNNGGAGGLNAPYAGGGGGGATAVGAAGNPIGGAGGAGATTSINASSTTFAGGGGGGGYVTAGGAGGAGGGGAEGVVGTAGTVNTGGGAGGTGNQQPGSPSGTSPQVGAAGGSGIVIIRYKFQ